MLIYLLSMSMSLFFGNNQPSNFYQSYSSAKEASKATQKEMVVFFTSRSCSNCESAWSAFAKDSKGAQLYVSTRMDIEDFDGGVCFDLFDVKQVPGWVILSPSSEVKEKWTGGWKDSSGNPTLFDQTIPPSIIEKKPVNTSNTNTIQKATPSSEIVVEKETPKISHGTNPNPVITQPTTGYFLQAGYFGSEGNAQKLISDLKTKGFANFKIENVQKDGSTFYRVVSKMYNAESEINVEQQRMDAAGIKTSVKKN
ncbi:MAG TPA: SPOR domain-containing protein [Saprospiraceae bacterium]|nr:SPOR domain-containing protein [Saprospiraceae bacterium]